MRTPAAVLAVGLALLAAGALADRAATPLLSEAEQAAAVAATRDFVTMTGHLRGTAGDRRFAERIRAAPELVEEVLADVALAHHAGRDEEPRLVRAEVREVRALEVGLVEVRTREFWVTRDRAAPGDDAVRSDVVPVRYVLAGAGAAWHVVGWDVDDDGPPAAGER